MIYYLKQEVKLNQEIDFQGLKVKVTQELIDNNPGLFEVAEKTESFPKYVEVTDSGAFEGNLDNGFEEPYAGFKNNINNMTEPVNLNVKMF